MQIRGSSSLIHARKLILKLKNKLLLRFSNLVRAFEKKIVKVLFRSTLTK